jgi:hypothetical protein
MLSVRVVIDGEPMADYAEAVARAWAARRPDWERLERLEAEAQRARR